MKNSLSIFTLILAGVMTTITATAGDKGVQPFCPCFTTEEIEAQLKESVIASCIDDRVNIEPGTSITSISNNNYSVSIEGRPLIFPDSTYSCQIVAGGDFVVAFSDIGFTNAMACRLTIINSPSWKNCPPAP